MEDAKVIGLTGLLGAGKGTVADYLVSKGFLYTSCSDYLRQELAKLGHEESIARLKALGDELREKYGSGYITEQLLQKIEGLTLVDSLRHPGEIEVLQRLPHFVLLAVDAPIEMRYERTQKRKRAGDLISFDEFAHQEKLQREGVGGQIQLNECLKCADYFIVNDGSIETLHEQVDQILLKTSFI